MSNPSIRVVIQLDYIPDDFIQIEPEDDLNQLTEYFVEHYLRDYVVEDLTDLMRNDSLSSWANITIINQEEKK